MKPFVRSLVLLALLIQSLPTPVRAQAAGTQAPAETSPAQTPAQPQAPPGADAAIVTDSPPPGTPAEELQQAWSMLAEAAADKHSEIRIQALAALGTLPQPQAIALIQKALADPDVDTRTAAILAAGQTHDPTLIAGLHTLLDDKEPQVAFAAATTLWKLHDHSGEDILIAVAHGDRAANATIVNGTMHTVNKDFHNPAMLARMGAEQGASLLLGPFGFGIGAYEAIRRNGGSTARVTAIEQIAEEHTAAARAEFLSALTDKDPGVRAAAAKALGAYPDPAVSAALYTLFLDSKLPVRFTAAASYLRTVEAAAHPTPPITRKTRGSHP